MALRRSEDYLAALRDGREVWLGGRRLGEVGAEPALAGCIASVADYYDLQHANPPVSADEADGERGAGPALTLARDDGELHGFPFLPPRTRGQLTFRRRAIEAVSRRSGGLLGRFPDYVPMVLTGLLDQAPLLERSESGWRQNLERYFAECRRRDLFLSHSYADPQIDRSRPSGELGFLRVVDRRREGIVVRGIKTVATLAPCADEYLVLTPPRRGLVPEQVAVFALPVASAGLRFVCREPFSGDSDADRPLGGRFDEIDAWALFDDVLVPWERVFLLGDQELLVRSFRTLNVWLHHHLLVRMGVKAELFAGLARMTAASLGIEGFQGVREALADLLRYRETLRAFVLACEAAAETSEAGLLRPDPRLAEVGHMYAVEHHPRLLHTLRELSGQSLLMAPRRIDLDAGKLRRHLGTAFGGDGEVEDRSRLGRLAWDLACSSFASRQLLFEMFNARSFTKNRLTFLTGYDTSEMESLARRLAGLEPPEAAPEPAPRWEEKTI